ncbi:MAG TPA: hypothetical protein PK614_08975 [Nitrospira sp.]|nr:hypothetical protein [Nitrospira sp.]
MISTIFVNLPVQDLDKSIAFLGRLASRSTPQCMQETAACMVMGDDIDAMLWTHEKVKEIADKALKVDAQNAYAPKALSRSLE